MGFLDYAGLQYLWDKLKEKFAPKSHNHDDRYYTETEINAKLGEKAANKTLSKIDLNTVKTPGFYSAAGGNGCTNVPVSDAFGLIVTHNAGGEYYTQIFFLINKNTSYRRYCNSGTWTKWTEEKLTDTNTWRGIQDNLTSDSKTDSLSAAQGKALKTLVDGKAANGHKHTKDQVGLSNVDNTADKDKTVASAAKLTTARTVSGGSDITLDFKYDGSGNSTANIGFYSCKHSVGNTNYYPFHRFAKLENLTGSYTDKTMLVYITQDYNGGCFGLCRLSLRTNNSSSVSTVEAKWLVRSGLSADFVQVAIYNEYGKTYADAFIKTNGIHAGTIVRSLSSGSRGNSGRTWTLISSNEVSGTTTTDKKTSSECWKTIADAGNELHKKAYSSSAPAIDGGYAASSGSANTAASCTGNSASATKLTSSAGSATQPIYFKDGKPVAGTYTLGDASSKMVRTLGSVGNIGWANKTTDDKYVPTMSFMAYWNGAYSSSGASNLQYCDRGRFGTIVTKNTGDYALAGHTHNYDSITGKPATYPPSVHSQSWSTITDTPALMTSGDYSADTIEALLKKVQGTYPKMGSAAFTKDTHVANTWWNFIYTPHRTGVGGDNGNYGTLLLFPMTGNGSSYIIRASKSGVVADICKIYTSSDKPTKGDIGLGNVDNTSDANKSVKYATSAGSASSATKATSADSAGTADIANALSGLSSRSSQSWGVQTGTFIHGENDGAGGSMAFRKNCPVDGQMSMVIDGRFYQNEGKYRVLDTSDEPNLNVNSANYIKDVKNSKSTTFAYSKDGMNYADYTWLAGWNGYELRAIDKKQFATASAGVTASGSNYIRFGNGTQICWGITNCKGKEATASFAVAFNNTDYAVTIMGNYGSWADTYWITGSHTTTSFAIKASGSALAARPINWIAVGTWK